MTSGQNIFARRTTRIQTCTRTWTRKPRKNTRTATSRRLPVAAPIQRESKQFAECGKLWRSRRERTMNKFLTAVISLAGVLAICGSVWAHHGNAAYDESKVVVLKSATVTKFAWANPHSIITFDAKEENGKMAHWAAELGSPSALTLLGWTKVSVQPGDEITVYIHQS